MADDANQEGEWITGFTGDILVDKQGNIIRSAEDEPSETPSVGDMLDALEETKWKNPPALDTPTESFPDWSKDVPTGFLTDQPDDTGDGTDATRADAETSI